MASSVIVSINIYFLLLPLLLPLLPLLLPLLPLLFLFICLFIIFGTESLTSSIFQTASFYNISETMFFPIWDTAAQSVPEVIVSGVVVAGDAFPGFSPSGNSDVFVGYLSEGMFGKERR
jgi:hypothetical protein